jgi:Na+-driven multidrug efflux pump
MNIINVTGNAIGIFVFHAGVAGVAVPTLISRMIAALLLCALAADKKNILSLKRANMAAHHREYAGRILSIAVPNGIENGLFSLGRLLVTSIVALFGTSQIAANGVSQSVNMIAIVFVNALNLAVITVVGQCVGAREYDEAKYWIKRLMIRAYAVTGALSLAVILFLPLILKLYALGGETARYAFILVVMHDVMASALHPTSFVLANALRASGDVRFTMCVGVASMIVFRLGSALLFGVFFNLGVIGVSIAMGTDWLARSVCFALRYRSARWMEHRAI